MHTITIRISSGKIQLICTCGKTKTITSTVDVGLLMNYYHAHLADTVANW